MSDPPSLSSRQTADGDSVALAADDGVRAFLAAYGPA
jgi:hypothetical protein